MIRLNPLFEYCSQASSVPGSGKPRRRQHGRYADLITFVKNRPEYDRRYTVDAAKIRGDLHWQPQERFESGLQDHRLLVSGV